MGGGACTNCTENIKKPPYETDLPKQPSVQNLYTPALGHNVSAMAVVRHLFTKHLTINILRNLTITETLH